MPKPRSDNPTPAKEDLGVDETAIRVHSDSLDELGRVQLSAFWLDGYLPPSGVRGQVFFTGLADFVRRNSRNGRKVTALDEHTHKLLDSLDLEQGK